MIDFYGVLITLESWGLMDVVLPFILVFLLVFVTLQKTKVLGGDENKKQFNIIMAAIIGLMVIIPHILGRYPPGWDVVNIINAVLPQVSLILVGILMMLMIAGFLTRGKLNGLAVMVSAIIVIFVFLGTVGFYQIQWIYDVFGTEVVSFLIVILVFGGIIWFITKDDRPTADKRTIKDWFANLTGLK